MSDQWSVWETPRGTRDVCDGPGPGGVVGEIRQDRSEWVIEGDAQDRCFLNWRAAAAAVLGRPLPREWDYYTVAREGQMRVVATDQSGLAALRNDGWKLIARGKPKG